MVGHMQPQAQRFTAAEARAMLSEQDTDVAWLSTSELEGWYGRLSAPGYLDASDWNGPFENAFRALRWVCSFYEVDTRGNERDGRW